MEGGFRHSLRNMVPSGTQRTVATPCGCRVPDADALVDVHSTFNVFGPTLSTAQPDNLTERTHSRMEWADLARVLGQPASYWPLMLRIPALIVAGNPVCHQ